jgi:hypothetical protein
VWVRTGGDGRADPRERPAAGSYVSKLELDVNDPSDTSDSV